VRVLAEFRVPRCCMLERKAACRESLSLKILCSVSHQASLQTHGKSLGACCDCTALAVIISQPGARAHTHTHTHARIFVFHCVCCRYNTRHKHLIKSLVDKHTGAFLHKCSDCDFAVAGLVWLSRVDCVQIGLLDSVQNNTVALVD